MESYHILHRQCLAIRAKCPVVGLDVERSITQVLLLDREGGAVTANDCCYRVRQAVVVQTRDNKFIGCAGFWGKLRRVSALHTQIAIFGSGIASREFCIDAFGAVCSFIPWRAGTDCLTAITGIFTTSAIDTIGVFARVFAACDYEGAEKKGGEEVESWCFDHGGVFWGNCCIGKRCKDIRLAEYFDWGDGF